MVSFNRPISCYYYKEKLFVLGNLTRSSLYLINKKKEIKELEISSEYQYMFGLLNKIFLINTNDTFCDQLDLDSNRILSRMNIDYVQEPKETFYNKKNQYVCFNYDPHLKLSIGISFSDSQKYKVYLSKKEFCGQKDDNEKKYVFFEFNEKIKEYICESNDGTIKIKKFPFSRYPKVGFRNPTSLIIKDDSFFILDSSNYSFKKFSINKLVLQWSIGKKGNSLREFDRCNFLLLLQNGEINLCDMNNDRILRFDHKKFFLDIKRDKKELKLNRPVSFTKSFHNEEINVVCRDNNSVYRLEKNHWKFFRNSKIKSSSMLIGYEVFKDRKFELFRNYQKFEIYEISKKLLNSNSSNKILSITGDIQDYDFFQGTFFLLNSKTRNIIKYHLNNNEISFFPVFQDVGKKESLSKGISFGKKGIIIVGFYTGLVNIYDNDNNLTQFFTLPECNDIFRKVIYLYNDLYLVLSRKMVRIFSINQSNYIFEFKNYKWSSPCDAIIKGEKIFISNKEMDSVEIINDFQKYLFI